MSAKFIFTGIPSDAELVRAIGEMTIAHSNLHLILRYVVKMLTGFTVQKALDCTDRMSAENLRKRVRALAKQRIGEGLALAELDALLTRARRASDQRNVYLHSAFAATESGSQIMHAESGVYSEPKITDVQELRDEMIDITSILNEGRLRGFIDQALKAAKNEA